MGGLSSIRALLLVLVTASAWGMLPGASATELEVARCPELGLTLLRPGWRWTLLGRDEASQLLPNAVLGAVGPGGQTVLVLADAEPGIDLDAFARVQLTSVPGSAPAAEALAHITYAGRPAVRLRVSYPQGAVWIDEEDLYFTHAGQLIHIQAKVPRAPRPGWAPSSGPGLRTDFDTALAAFHAALSLEEVTQPALLPPSPTRDRRGVGWRVHDGVFEHALAGVELPIDPAWSILPAAAALRVDEDAELVLLHRETGAVLVWLYDMDVGVAEDVHRDVVLRMLLQANPGSVVGEPRSTQLLGNPLTFATCALGDPWPREIGCAVRRLGPEVMVVRVLAPQRGLAAAWEAVAHLLAAARPLDAAAREQLATEMAALPDPDDRIDATACVRGGVWTDFRPGLRWTKPSATWRIRTVSAVDSLLLVRDLATGVVARLQSIPAPPRGPLGSFTPSPADWHQTVLARAGIQGRPVRSMMPMAFAGREALFTSWVLEFAPGGELVVALGTLPWKDGCLVCHIVGPVAGNAEADDAMGAAVAAFSALGEGEDRQVVSARRLADRRLGLSLTLPGEGWIVRDETPPGLAPRGGLLHALGPQQDATVAVLFAEGSEAVARDAVIAEIRRNLGSLFLSAQELPPHPGRLLGLEATCHAWRVGEARADLWVASAGEVIYALCVATRPDGSGLTIEDLAPALQWVR
ncbi:MAG: hypothetical protein H6806_12530 [Planctomycetes bacterium]|nr:hypothetical protein [Planctomycetota bacterium]MCB9830570.1 hypothetical protein [Planctomycetota bacterium]MCB9901145.1 hypothetical protein [Planctomycetota bacterium]